MTTRKRKNLSLPQSESGDGERPPKKLIQSQSDTNSADHHHLSPFFSMKDPVRLSDSFFHQPCVDLAKAFLGKVNWKKGPISGNHLIWKGYCWTFKKSRS